MQKKIVKDLIQKFSINESALLKYLELTTEEMRAFKELDSFSAIAASNPNFKELTVAKQKLFELFSENSEEALLKLTEETDKIKLKDLKKQIESILRKDKLYRFITRENDNLLSFFCGIFSNIPISLLFTMNKWGNSCWEHAYFIVWVLAFIISVCVTTSAFAVTLRKLNIKKSLEGKNSLNKFNVIEKHYKYNELKIYFVGWLITFLVCIVLLLGSAISLWILFNKIPVTT